LSCQATDDSRPLLEDVSFTLAPGQSLAVIGATGAGKSVLLQAILGEIPLAAGSLSWTGTGTTGRPGIGLLGQQPFVLNASIANNITFGAAIRPETAPAELEQHTR